jgi:hypothetical protein
MRALMVLLVAAACSTSDGGAPPPVDAKPASDSICGNPGDPGNEMGVGKYCNAIDDCSGGAASLCAILGDPRAHFCTKTCMAGQGAEACGAAAACQCQGGLCGCLPNACL